MASLQPLVERARGLVGRDVSGLGPPAKGVVTLVRERSDQLFYVYAGAKGRLMLDPRKFFRKTRLFERNVAFLRDARPRFYLRGVPSLDSFDALLDWQTALPQQLAHVRRRFCLGTSMGAYAAILFGHLLKVEQVWAFGPPLTLLGRFQEAPPAHRDLALLLSSPNGVTRFHVHYNETVRRDRESAQRLAGCSGVTLHPHDGDGHNVVETLIERGLLDGLLPDPSDA